VPFGKQAGEAFPGLFPLGTISLEFFFYKHGSLSWKSDSLANKLISSFGFTMDLP
jgi:hypothetical protein